MYAFEPTEERRVRVEVPEHCRAVIFDGDYHGREGVTTRTLKTPMSHFTEVRFDDGEAVPIYDVYLREAHREEGRECSDGYSAG